MKHIYTEQCHNCPYYNKSHLKGTKFNYPNSGPLSMEKGKNAEALLVLQAPGVKEWKMGKPAQPSPRSAGRRLELSWERCNVSRNNFDITNAVQCYPGKNSKGRDCKPRAAAVNSCYSMLKQDLLKKRYKWVVAFGKLAQKMVKKAVTELGLEGKIKVINRTHPSGGLTNKSLDST